MNTIETEFNKNEVANLIIDMYLKRFPRPVNYAIKLTSNDDYSEETYYHTFTNEELVILQEWEDKYQEEMLLGEYLLELNTKEANDLYTKCINNNSPYNLDVLYSFNNSDTLDFYQFTMHVLDNGQWEKPVLIKVPLDNDEFRQILCDIMTSKKKTNINTMMKCMPELTNKICRHLSYIYTDDDMFEMTNPFLFEPKELAEIAEQILNPHVDVLDIFESNNENINKFLSDFAFVPKFHSIYSNNKITNFYFINRRMFISKSIFTEDMQYPQDEQFSMDAEKICDKMHFGSYNDLFKYMMDNYEKDEDCYAHILQWAKEHDFLTN